MFRLSPILLLLLVPALPASPQGERPKFQFLRQNEDWSGYGRSTDLGSTDDITDVLKYIPLTDSGDVWLSIGGHARARFEAWNNFGFGIAPVVSHDDEFLLTRYFVHTDLHIGENNRIFIEGKTVQSTNRDLPGGTRTLDVDSLDLQQAFWDHSTTLGDADVTLRVGRQKLSFGKQRLVSPLPWGNTLRSWDGVQAMWKQGPWNVNAFWTLFSPVDIGDFNEPMEELDFYGVYATKKTDEGLIDLYFLGYDRPMATFNGTMGNETRYTVGARANGKRDALDGDFEAAYQFGEVGSGDITAYMLAVNVGYRLEDVPTKPRVFLGLDLASGDSGAGGNVETFNQLYPLGHAYFGLMDAVGRQNILDLSAGFSHDVTDRLSGNVAAHLFRLADEDDALYNAGGGVFVPGGTSSSTTVGSEIDVSLKYKIDRHFVATAGYGHFFADSVVEDAGGDDSDFVYVSLQYTF